MVELSVQVTEHQATCKNLSCENNLLNKRIREIYNHDSKGKGETRRMQIQLEVQLIKAKANMTASLERNSVLVRELIWMNTEFEKALKWTTSSQDLTTLTS